MTLNKGLFLNEALKVIFRNYLASLSPKNLKGCLPRAFGSFTHLAALGISVQPPGLYRSLP
jgi:hypothetical protein